MKKGNLSAREISKLSGVWQTLEDLQAQIPATPSNDEKSVLNKLLDARNAVSALIQSQSYDTWLKLQEQKGGKAA